MKKWLLSFSLLVVAILAIPAATSAQWNCVLATQDDTPNGPSDQVPSVAVIDENTFVALVVRESIPVGQTVPTWDDVNTKDSVYINYLVSYSHATDTTGRKEALPGYGSALSGRFTKWVSGFNEISLYRAYKAVATPDSLIYVANNDPNHNILVFRYKDSVQTTDYSLQTDPTGTSGSAGDIMGIAIDNNGYVYVLNIYGSTANTTEVKVFKGIKASPDTWGSDPHTDTPVATINLPAGVYRGLTVSPDGKQLFISSMTDRNVVKYSGSPTTGYTKALGFTFALSALDSLPRTMYIDSTVVPHDTSWDFAKPLGMAYLSPNNLLFVTAARWLGNNILAHNGVSGYEYSKIFELNPNTGARMDSLDVANYYYVNSDTAVAGRSYTTQIFGTQHVSGYASLYDVGFDKNKDMYTQSFYSWTVERWHYTGTLPTVIVAGVREISNAIPDQYSLAQNYPNPFNPATTIRFTMKTASHVELIVTNILGQKVSTLVNQDIAVGTHEVTFDASRMASGVYFYTLKVGNFIDTKKMILTK